MESIYGLVFELLN